MRKVPARKSKKIRPTSNKLQKILFIATTGQLLFEILSQHGCLLTRSRGCWLETLNRIERSVEICALELFQLGKHKVFDSRRSFRKGRGVSTVEETRWVDRAHTKVPPGRRTPSLNN